MNWVISPLKKGIFWLILCVFILSFSSNTNHEKTSGTEHATFTLPLNDKVCQALPLQFSTPIDFNNSLATAEQFEVSPGKGTNASACIAQNGWCASETAIQNSIWYYFIPTEDQNVNLEALGGDVQLAVYQVRNCSNFDTFKKVAANDNTKMATSALIQNMPVKAGESYYVQIDGHNGAKIYGGKLILEKGDALIVEENPCNKDFQHMTIGETGVFPGLADFDLCRGIFDITSSTSANNLLEDGMQLSYTELCGDGEIVVNINNITGKGFAGLSLRESLDPQAKTLNLFRQSFNDYVFREVRLEAGEMLNVKKSLYPINTWLKISRKGNRFNCYTSSNGSDWLPFSSLYFKAEECLLAGIAVKSESQQTTTVASFEQLLIIEGIKIKTKPNSTNRNLNQYATTPIISDFYPKGVTKGATSLEIQMPNASEAKVNVFDRAGRQIQQRAVSLNEGSNTILFDVRDWPEGKYVAFISTKQSTTPKTFAVLN
jgi:hypothetical protein